MQTSLQSTRNIVLAFALAVAATPVHAQGMFRSVMPDGKIVYGDKPAPGAKESKKVNLAPLNIATPSQAASPAADPAAAGTPGADTNADIAAARQKLDAAQKALEQGRAEREGDRIGTTSGKSRLNDSYLDRVKSLENGVSAAQQQFDAAQRAGR
jgi:hypothetical protein